MNVLTGAAITIAIVALVAAIFIGVGWLIVHVNDTLDLMEEEDRE